MLFGVGHLFLFFVLLSRFTNKNYFLLFYIIYVVIDIALICLSYSRTMNSEWKECPPVSTSTALFVISLFLNVKIFFCFLQIHFISLTFLYFFFSKKKLMEVGLALSIRKAVQELTTQGSIFSQLFPFFFFSFFSFFSSLIFFFFQKSYCKS